VLWGWVFYLGGPDWEILEGGHRHPREEEYFYFSDAGNYTIQAFFVESGQGTNGDHLPDPVPLSIESNVITVTVK